MQDFPAVIYHRFKAIGIEPRRKCLHATWRRKYAGRLRKGSNPLVCCVCGTVRTTNMQRTSSYEDNMERRLFCNSVDVKVMEG
jgi:hypothetical protein